VPLIWPFSRTCSDGPHSKLTSPVCATPPLIKKIHSVPPEGGFSRLVSLQPPHDFRFPKVFVSVGYKLTRRLRLVPVAFWNRMDLPLSHEFPGFFFSPDPKPPFFPSKLPFAPALPGLCAFRGPSVSLPPLTTPTSPIPHSTVFLPVVFFQESPLRYSSGVPDLRFFFRLLLDKAFFFQCLFPQLAGCVESPAPAGDPK